MTLSFLHLRVKPNKGPYFTLTFIVPSPYAPSYLLLFHTSLSLILPTRKRNRLEFFATASTLKDDRQFQQPSHVISLLNLYWSPSSGSCLCLAQQSSSIFLDIGLGNITASIFQVSPHFMIKGYSLCTGQRYSPVGAFCLVSPTTTSVPGIEYITRGKGQTRLLVWSLPTTTTSHKFTSRYLIFGLSQRKRSPWYPWQNLP